MKIISIDSTVPSEIQIMTREYFNRWYRLRTTFIAHAIANIVVGSVSIASYVLIVYLMSDQVLEPKRIALFTLDGILIGLINQTLGLMFGISLSVKVFQKHCDCRSYRVIL